jgi:hypothetical protein
MREGKPGGTEGQKPTEVIRRVKGLGQLQKGRLSQCGFSLRRVTASATSLKSVVMETKPSNEASGGDFLAWEEGWCGC